ncbi:MAG: CRISPR-associated helicase Cas3' [Steroidobacter sp.]
METIYFAHSENNYGVKHRLDVHLRSVSQLAESFAENSRWKAEAMSAGLLHDLGKYGDLFQARLRGEEAGLDHWSAGANVALLKFRTVAAALAIEGHHIGLQAANTNSLRRVLVDNLIVNHPLKLRLSDSDFARVFSRADTDGLRFAQPSDPMITSWEHSVAKMLDVRMLFSCLVDADFLDTEAHFQAGPEGKRRRAPGPKLDTTRAALALEQYMANNIRMRPASSSSVAAVRSDLWAAATDAATASPGIFSLTAPTGSGKTLAMLQFALKHAEKNNCRRIILVVPYLSIIEQTARIYRSIFSEFGPNFVLEHHSLAGLGNEQSKSDAEGTIKDDTERQRRLLSENWDAPIVITTNVQLLESMFSNRPSTCRKLHNLMGSVILFDEAQSLPQQLAVPTLAALSHLSTEYKSSVVFATATQPAFNILDVHVKKYAGSGWQPREIVSGNRKMFKIKRVAPEWPKEGETIDWPDLAAELRSNENFRVLCVVNLKRHALALLKQLDGVDGLYHLSTNMCTAHRREVLDQVRKQLSSGDPCRLISTQCVEAGVDLDFPVVYRAMGPLESIAQAAGRCNREGRLPTFGRVKVFQPPVGDSGRRYLYPTAAYYLATEVTLSLLKQHGVLDIDDPEVFAAYYRRLYDLSQPADQNTDLTEAITALDFPEIAKHYRLIEKDAIQVVVPWLQQLDEYERLSEQAKYGINGDWITRAQSLSVSIYKPRGNSAPWGGLLIPARFRRGGDSDEWFILEDRERKFYDDILGLQLPTTMQTMIA